MRQGKGIGTTRFLLFCVLLYGALCFFFLSILAQSFCLFQLKITVLSRGVDTKWKIISPPLDQN